MLSRNLEKWRYGKSTDTSKVAMDREASLAMPVAEKRRLYVCGNKYVTLGDIDTWPTFATKMKTEVKARRSTRQQTPPLTPPTEQLFPVNPELNRRISLWTGDITHLEIDCIVNAANSSLLGGGGVDGAIHDAAGRQLVNECRTLDGCDAGEAKSTAGYRLPAKYVIHTVGPTSTKPTVLQSCYTRCLEEMLSLDQKSIAFPCVSTGIYGYPNEAAAHVALATIRRFLQDLQDCNELDRVDRVIFCLFLNIDIKIYTAYMHHYFPLGKDDGGSSAADEATGGQSTRSANSPERLATSDTAGKSPPRTTAAAHVAPSSGSGKGGKDPSTVPQPMTKCLKVATKMEEVGYVATATGSDAVTTATPSFVTIEKVVMVDRQSSSDGNKKDGAETEICGQLAKLKVKSP